MAKQVVGLFESMQDAHGAVQALTNAGFTADDISIVANNSGGTAGDGGDGGSEAAEGAGAGATGGAVLGGLGGLLVGLGALAIPGIGPVVAAGSLATTLGTTLAGAGLGAAAGGLVGALVGAGIPEEDAGVYAEGVRRGGALVTVQAATDDDADRAADILDQYGVVDIDERAQDYRAGGWSGFDENAGGYDTTGTGAMGGSGAGAMGSGSGADAPQSEWSESSKVGTAGGGLAGAASGAAIGSVGGPVGTVVGGVAGALTGAGVGAAGDTAGEAAKDRSTGEDDTGQRGSSGYTTSGSGDYGTTSGTGSGAAIGSATDYGTSGGDAATNYTTSSRDMTTTGTTGGGATIGSATDYGTSGDVSTTGTTGTTSGAYTADTTASSFQAGTRDIDQGEVAIPVVEEEIRVGKREVESGGVRVETRVEETPVREQVNLRDEQVRVERRAVDQPVDASTVTDAFREGTFEVRERDEQAVVQKEARVVEEVVVNRDVQQRTETIEDTVRRTDVDVQQVPGETRTTGYTDTTASTGTTSGEGPIEGALGDARAGFERGTGIDADRSGDVGNRDRGNNF